MDPSASATAAAMSLQPRMYDVPVGLTYVDPAMQQHHDGRTAYDTSDAQAMMQAQALYQHQFAQHSVPSALLGRKHAPDRRPLRFWQPFNDWWRAELTRLGRRPTSDEIGEWYIEASERTWGDTKPTLQETRVHAKCLRSLPLVRDYFRNYRAKKKAKGSDGSGYDGEDTPDGDTEEGTDNGGSNRRRQPCNKRARLGASSHLSDAGGPGQALTGKGNYSDPGAAAAATGLDLMQLQAYQAQGYWDPAQTEEYARQVMLQQMQQAALYQQLAAQQLSSDTQLALLQQQQLLQRQLRQGPQDADTAVPSMAAEAATASQGPDADAGAEPVSGAAGDDEHADHEPSAHVAGPRPCPTAQDDTATSNACLQSAAQSHPNKEEGVLAQPNAFGMEAHDLMLQQGSPHAGDELRQTDRAGQASLAEHKSQQQQQVPDEDRLEDDAVGDCIDDDTHVDDAGDVRMAEIGTVDEVTAVATADTADVTGAKAEYAFKQPAAGDQDAQLHRTPQQQLSKHPPEQPQQQEDLLHCVYQAVELDLRDQTAQHTSQAHADKLVDGAQHPEIELPSVQKGHSQRQQQQQAWQLVEADKVKNEAPPQPADLQEALMSAAAAVLGAHGSSAVCSAVQAPTQGVAAKTAAAAVANASGLNLSDSPHIHVATGQDSSHPGAWLPDAAVTAAITATGSRLPRNGTEQQVHTPDVEQPRAVSIEIEEAVLLNDVEMGGMSHDELVAHIRKVQQELLGKRQLLQRSFDQLRRTQDRLARRERKLAKEQQKCKQYQTAVATWQAAWQAAGLPSIDPASNEPENEQQTATAPAGLKGGAAAV